MTDAGAPDWTAEYRRLWDQLVPKRGPAKTLQGELIRLIGKLADEAFRNGNQNWTSSHVNAWQFIAERLNDPVVFSKTQRAEIKRHARWIVTHYDQIPVTKAGSSYYVLAERAVEWCRAHPQPVPFIYDKSLYYF